MQDFDLFKLIKELGIFTIGSFSIVALLSYLGRTFLVWYIDKSMSLYKNDLSKEVELHKAELMRLTNEVQIKYKLLQEDRIKLIKDLYKLLYEYQNTLNSFISGMNNHTSTESLLAIITNLIEIERRIQSLFETNVIFFSLETATQIKIILDEHRKITLPLFGYIKNKGISSLKDNDEVKDSMNKLNIYNTSQIQPLVYKLQESFRELLGVTQI